MIRRWSDTVIAIYVEDCSLFGGTFVEVVDGRESDARLGDGQLGPPVLDGAEGTDGTGRETA